MLSKDLVGSSNINTGIYDVNGAFLQYSLVTLPAKSQILEAMNVIEDDAEPFTFTPSQYEELVARIQAYENKNDLTWIVLN